METEKRKTMIHKFEVSLFLERRQPLFHFVRAQLDWLFREMHIRKAWLMYFNFHIALSA